MRRRWRRSDLRPTAAHSRLAIDHYQIGLSSLETGDVEAAAAEFSTCIDIDPGDAEAHLLLALAHHRSGNAERAALHAARAITLDPLLKTWSLFRDTFGDRLSAIGVHYLSDYIRPLESDGNLLLSIVRDGRKAPAGSVPLGLDATVDGNAITISGRKFDKGMGTHANAELVFDLSDGAYDLFTCWVGPDDESFDPQDPAEPSVVFEVHVDGRCVFNSGIMTRGQIRRVSVPIAGARKLGLVVGDGGNWRYHDHADWADAALVELGIPLAADAPTPTDLQAEGLQHCEGRLHQSLDDPNLHNEMGLARMLRGDFPQALEQFRTALALDASFAPAYTNAALTYARMYAYEDARPFWEGRAGLPQANVWDAVAQEEANARLVDARLLLAMPEVYAHTAPWDEIILYRRLVARLPESAQRWVLGMGQFLDDRRLDESEREALRAIARKDDPLAYLTHPRILDGIGRYDLEWLEAWSPRRGDYMYLDRDLETLERGGMAASSTRPALAALIAAAATDAEVEKGLYLIGNLGRAPDYLFRWRRRSDLNTQLLVLCRLLEDGIPAGEERLAVAGSLGYGALLVVADEQAWPYLTEDLRQRLALVRETTPLLHAQGADWDPREYPLEACLGLLWPGVCMSADPRVRTVPLDLHCREQGMGQSAFKSHLVSCSTLREMRDAFLERGLFSQRTKLAATVASTPCLADHYSSDIDAAAYFAHHELALADAKPSYPEEWPRWDVNWQWEHVKRTGDIAGWCTEWGPTVAFFLRSLNIAPLESPHQHWYYEPARGVWRADTWEQTHWCNDTDHPQHPCYWRFPWDNFHLPTDSEVGSGAPKEYDPVRNIFCLMRDKSTLPAHGIPLGYMFRRITRIR